MPRSLAALVVAATFAGLLLGSQPLLPVPTGVTAGTAPSTGRPADPGQTDRYVAVTRPAISPTPISPTPIGPTPIGPTPIGPTPIASTAPAQNTEARKPKPSAAVESTPTPTSSSTTPTALPVVPTSGTTVYLHYYLWWTQRHWQDKLGTAYPYTADPLPLPGQTDASGCSPTVAYPGATIVDIPSEGLYNQALAATFDSHIETAVAYGITGFVADWAGIGTTDQLPSSSGYNGRLDLLVQRVDAWNAAHAQKFRLALDFAAFGNYNRPASAMINDLNYFVGRYGSDPAFANAFSNRPLAMIIGSRKYSLATIQAVSEAMRPSLFLLGDETYTSLARDAAYLDGSSYYWSSESPSNSGAKTQIASLGSQLHAAGKPWFAPFTAGYNSVLIGGHCVPRNGLETLRTIWSWNGASNPDAWFGISWNEYVENTYLEPSLKYGATYLAEIARLAGH